MTEVQVHPDKNGDTGTGDAPLVETSASIAQVTPPGPTTLAKLSGLPWSIAGNALNSIFAQFTFFGSVFVLFLNALGLSKTEIGGLLSVLPFTSVLAIIAAPAVARFGYKRTFLTAYGMRTVVTGFLLLTPWVVATYGSTRALQFVTLIVFLFALLRALMEIGYIPWVQEYVPNAVRGKYAARDNMFATLAGMFAIIVAGIAVGRSQGLTGYMLLIGAGVLLAFGALWCYTFIPGGASVRVDPGGASRFDDMRRGLLDADYRRYLLGVSLIALGAGVALAFLPLYLEEQVGIPTGRVIWVQLGTLTGSLISSFLWGWAADRYGSKPVMRTGAALLAVVPLFWWLLPRQTPATLYIALGIALFQGIASLGWVIGAGRLLHVSLVPPARKAGYMALYSAWIGIVSGISTLAAGRILQKTQGLSAQAGPLMLDPYVPLFLIGVVVMVVGLPILHGIRSEDSVGVREFAGLFFKGNPFLAMTSLIRNQLATDERTVVLRTEQLGMAHSRLTVEELLEALSDPRYHVRYEAEIVISRMRRDPRLTQAMVRMLEGTELALSAQAAWALGRMADPDAIEPLRKAAKNPYRSVRMQSIRALGWLGDGESIPMFLDGLRSEQDKGLRMAYSSALGNLRAREATTDLLHYMETTENPGARMELALALARLVGREHLFMRLLRQMRTDPGTTAAQALANIKRRVQPHRGRKQTPSPRMAALDACIDAYAAEDLDNGAMMLARILTNLPTDVFDESTQHILEACSEGLSVHRSERLEYVILALHTLNVAWQAGSVAEV